MATETRQVAHGLTHDVAGSWVASSGTLASCFAIAGDGLIATASAGSNGRWSLASNFAIPSTATVNYVRIVAKVRNDGSGSSTVNALIRDGGTNYNSPTGNQILNGTTWVDLLFDWATDPRTGAAWTYDGANSIQGIGLDPGDVAPPIEVDYLAAIVDYSDGSTPPGSGTATGTLTWTGTATGKRVPVAAAAGSLTWTGAAAGKRSPVAIASGVLAWAGTAVGKRSPVGQAAGTLTWTGTAVGAAPSGSTPATGTAAGTLTWSGTAVGKRSPVGQAAGQLAWSGVAVGARASRGVAAGVLTWVGAAVGVAGLPAEVAPAVLRAVGRRFGYTARGRAGRYAARGKQ